MTNDVVIVDANCFKYLENPDVAARVERSLRAARLTIWPTALNALELAQSHNPRVRRRALQTAARFLGDRPLLPFPNDVLRRAGEATLNGDKFFQFGQSGFEWLLLNPQDITPTNVTEIQASLRPSEEALSAAFKRGRPEIRRFLSEHGLEAEWASAQDFLDRQFLGGAYEDLYDRFEVLNALAHADQRSDTGNAWGPPGRFLWKARHAGGPLAEIEKEAKVAGAAWPFVKAGMFGGSSERFQAILTNYREWMRRVSVW